MVELSATVERRGDASLVELVVDNDTPDPRRIRVANCLDGPVWPPRSEGVPADGWDDGGFEGVVAPGERLGLGYACPGEPADPPAEIAWSERAAGSDRDGSDSADGIRSDSPGATGTAEGIRSDDPESVLRTLGDPRPPRDVVADAPDADSGDAARSCAAPPEGVEEWFGSVEVRIERGDALAEPATLLDAAKSVEQEGSLATVEELVEQLEADADALRRVERHAAALAGRAEDAVNAVPLSSFRRLS